MVIDAHTHLYSGRLTADYWLSCMARYGSAISGRSSEYVRQKIETGWFDETGDLLIADMDEAGIDRSIVFVLDMGLYNGVDDDVALSERYAAVAKIVANHPGRLSLVGGVDPRRPDAATFVRRAVETWGISGVKIWPPAGCKPNAAYCYRLYQVCAEEQLPVIVHTGQEIAPLESDMCRPTLVDEPARSFPEINFILAHAGMGWWEEAAEMAWHHPNVYLDIAYWQSKYLRHKDAFGRQLRQLMSAAGPGKVLFGSDWPALRAVRGVSHAEWVKLLQGLPVSGLGGETFHQHEIDSLMGGAAEKVLLSRP
jgi:predicted TIM-barrel fold metal-dependent hydrolase